MGVVVTFDEFFEEHKLTKQERTALVWHLAAFRARRTIELLLHPPVIDIRDYGAKTKMS